MLVIHLMLSIWKYR